MRQNVFSELANFCIFRWIQFVYPTMGILFDHEFFLLGAGRGPVWFLKDSLKLPIMVWNKRDQAMQMHSEFRRGSSL